MDNVVCESIRKIESGQIVSTITDQRDTDGEEKVVQSTQWERDRIIQLDDLVNSV